MREKRIDAVIGAEPAAREQGYMPTGPALRETKIAEHRQPAFYRIHYQNSDGRTHVAYRLADCDKHAIDLIQKLGRATRLAKFSTRQEFVDSLPPGRSLRAVLPPLDLQLAFQLGLIFKTDLT